MRFIAMKKILRNTFLVTAMFSVTFQNCGFAENFKNFKDLKNGLKDKHLLTAFLSSFVLSVSSKFLFENIILRYGSNNLVISGNSLYGTTKTKSTSFKTKENSKQNFKANKEEHNEEITKSENLDLKSENKIKENSTNGSISSESISCKSEDLKPSAGGNQENKICSKNDNTTAGRETENENKLFYQKIGIFKILICFFIWYFFRLTVKSVFFLETIINFAVTVYVRPKSHYNKNLSESLKKRMEYFHKREDEINKQKFEEGLKQRKQRINEHSPENEKDLIFYVKQQDPRKKSNVIILNFSGLGGGSEPQIQIDHDFECDLATVKYRYYLNKNENIFKRFKNLFMVSESSIYKDAEKLYDYITDTLGYQNVIIKTHSFGGTIGAHVVKYAEKKAKKNNESSKVKGLFIGSSICGIYTSARQFTFELLRRIFEESKLWHYVCHFLKYPAALIAKIALIDYSFDPLDSLKKLENKDLKIVVADGGKEDFLNNDVIKLKEKLENIGINKVSLARFPDLGHSDAVNYGVAYEKLFSSEN